MFLDMQNQDRKKEPSQEEKIWLAPRTTNMPRTPDVLLLLQSTTDSSGEGMSMEAAKVLDSSLLVLLAMAEEFMPRICLGLIAGLNQIWPPHLDLALHEHPLYPISTSR